MERVTLNPMGLVTGMVEVQFGKTGYRGMNEIADEHSPPMMGSAPTIITLHKEGYW